MRLYHPSHERRPIPYTCISRIRVVGLGHGWHIGFTFDTFPLKNEKKLARMQFSLGNPDPAASDDPKEQPQATPSGKVSCIQLIRSKG